MRAQGHGMFPGRDRSSDDSWHLVPKDRSGGRFGAGERVHDLAGKLIDLQQCWRLFFDLDKGCAPLGTSALCLCIEGLLIETQGLNLSGGDDAHWRHEG